MINWLLNNWIEIAAVITGLVYIFLSIKQNIWCWIFGIVSSGLYLFVFFQSKIYADMLLQAYYVLMGIYGWVHWARQSPDKPVEVSILTKLQWVWLTLVSGVLFIILAWFLIRFTDSPVPYIDAFTTALSFTATYMLARKILEHWLIWIVVDAVSIGLYFYRELYATIILFAVLTVMAAVGYWKWKKEWNNNL